MWEQEYTKAVETYGEDFDDEHRFQVPKDCHWNIVRETPANVGTALQNALRGIEALALPVDGLLEALKEGGLPCTAASFYQLCEPEHAWPRPAQHPTDVGSVSYDGYDRGLSF